MSLLTLEVTSRWLETSVSQDSPRHYVVGLTQDSRRFTEELDLDQ